MKMYLLINGIVLLTDKVKLTIGVSEIFPAFVADAGDLNIIL